jgi:hypothetical protein
MVVRVWWSVYTLVLGCLDLDAAHRSFEAYLSQKHIDAKLSDLHSDAVDNWPSFYLVRGAFLLKIMTQPQFDATMMPVKLPQTFGQLRCKPDPTAPDC